LRWRIVKRKGPTEQKFYTHFSTLLNTDYGRQQKFYFAKSHITRGKLSKLQYSTKNNLKINMWNYYLGLVKI
jgi:hypothetical protein